MCILPLRFCKLRKLGGTSFKVCKVCKKPKSVRNQICATKFDEEQHAKNRFFQSYRMNLRVQQHLFILMESCQNEKRLFFMSKFHQLGSIKIQFSVFANMVKPFDKTRFSCYASSFSKLVSAEFSVDDIFDMVI